MTQWKLVPREPTPEMIDAATGSINDGMPDEDYNDSARSYLISAWDAAPSPAGGEDEVERVADAIIAEQAGPAKKLSDITSPYGRDYELRKARAAISAMRPTLSAEDRAILSRVRARRNSFNNELEAAGEYETHDLAMQANIDADVLLSLIDNLTEAG